MQNPYSALLKEAGKLLASGFWGTKEVVHKGSIDLVTDYDVAVEALLIEGFKNLLPHHAIISEEDGSLAHHNAENKIIIDPIDGTTNFVHGLPHVAISIGIYREGILDEGIVYNPLLEECFYAKRGEGAWCNGTRLEVTTTRELKHALIATGFPYSIDSNQADYLWVMQTLGEMVQKTQGVRRLGAAALDLAYVAAGRFDGFYEKGLKPWDVAAGMLLVIEAGGQISEESGAPYCPFRSDVVIASNGGIHRSFCEVITPLR